jgi:hypothetical protein
MAPALIASVTAIPKCSAFAGWFWEREEVRRCSLALTLAPVSDQTTIARCIRSTTVRRFASKSHRMRPTERASAWSFSA